MKNLKGQNERIETKPEIEWSIKMMTDRMRATAAATNAAIAKAVQMKGWPPSIAMNKGWCLGCKQRGGECQCAELGTDPEWVDYEP